MKKCFAALGAMLLVAGCGDHPSTRPVSRCELADYAMQCVKVEAPRSLTLLQLAPTVARGVDFAWGPPSAGWMRARGFAFGASYLSYDPSKDWTWGLVDAFAARGIARVFVWETTATRALGGCGAGASDARAARREAGPFHARAIYFAVDFEEASSEVSAVNSYFRCADHVIGFGHMGGYGGYWTIARLFDAHLIRYGWQTYAWSGGRWDSRVQLEQYLNGSSYDLDRAVASDYGQTPYVAPRPKPKPRHRPHQPTQLQRLIARRAALRQLLFAEHCRVKHPSRHCRGVLKTGARVNRAIHRLGGR